MCSYTMHLSCGTNAYILCLQTKGVRLLNVKVLHGLFTVMNEHNLVVMQVSMPHGCRCMYA
jgi:hypothetical protein